MPTWPTGHDGASGPCSHMASFLHDWALVGISRRHGGLCLTNSGFWKYSWAHSVMLCRWAIRCCLRAWRPRASSKGLLLCPLRTEISPVPLKLLMMLCTVDGEICKAFAIWRWGTLFLKYPTIFLRTLKYYLYIITKLYICIENLHYNNYRYILFIY